MTRTFLAAAVVATSTLIAGGALAGCGSAVTDPAQPPGTSAAPQGGGDAPGPAGGAAATPAATNAGPHRLRNAVADGRPRHRRPSRSSSFRFR
jgi:hypothetical protein